MHAEGEHRIGLHHDDVSGVGQHGCGQAGPCGEGGVAPGGHGVVAGGHVGAGGIEQVEEITPAELHVQCGGASPGGEGEEHIMVIRSSGITGRAHMGVCVGVAGGIAEGATAGGDVHGIGEHIAGAGCFVGTGIGGIAETVAIRIR